MEPNKRIERALERSLSYATAPGCPPKLAGALRHALFPGGARIRPRLTLAVAMACGDPNSDAADAAAAAIELMHCASLVHDDLPCFDDAETRRGKPSAHKAFGEPVAVLAGDGMIVLAFETIVRGCALTPNLTAPLCAMLGRAVGMPGGIVAGQAWESEDQIDLETYHRQKTGALFMGATALGAIAAEADPQQWMNLGSALGSAYQVADDLHDYAAQTGAMGKPCGQDVAHGRPNAAAELGVQGSLKHLQRKVDEAVDAVPDCKGAGMLRMMIAGEAKRLVPANLDQSAA